MFALLLSMPLCLVADVTVTRLANEGVILSDDRVRIMIDGMVVEPYSVYGGLDRSAAQEFSQATGPFAGVSLALSSHRHHDHNQPVAACRFLQASPQTRFVSSSQVVDLMEQECGQLIAESSRIEEISPLYGKPATLASGDVRITVFPLSHGTGRFSDIQNYGHLVEQGGMTMLHIGDAAMVPADFQKAGLDQVDLDLVFIPYWYFQSNQGLNIINRFLDAPHKMAVHIPPREMGKVRAYMNSNHPGVVVLESPLDEIAFGKATRKEP